MAPPHRPYVPYYGGRNLTRSYCRFFYSVFTIIYDAFAGGVSYAGTTPRGVMKRYVHLDAALVIAADQASAEIARLLDGGEVFSMKEAKRLRFSEGTKLLSI